MQHWAEFDFTPKSGGPQHVEAYGLTDEQVAEIRAAVNSRTPDATIRVSCSVTPGAESTMVRVFNAARITNLVIH